MLRAAVRNRAAAPDARRTELLARKERIKGFLVRDAGGGFKDQTGLFEETLAAGDVQVEPARFRWSRKEQESSLQKRARAA
jgi:hypothetical protein